MSKELIPEVETLKEEIAKAAQAASVVETSLRRANERVRRLEERISDLEDT